MVRGQSIGGAGLEPSRDEACPLNLVEEIASAYLIQADGDLSAALRIATSGAVADFLELERRTRCAERLVSWGFVRGLHGDGQTGPQRAARNPRDLTVKPAQPVDHLPRRTVACA